MISTEADLHTALDQTWSSGQSGLRVWPGPDEALDPVGRTDVVLRTTDREEAIRVLVPRIVPLLRGQRSLQAVDADALVGAR